MLFHEKRVAVAEDDAAARPDGLRHAGTGLSALAWASLLFLSGAVLMPLNLRSAEPVNNRFSNAIRIEGSTGSVAGSNHDATSQEGEPAHAGVSNTRSVWYRWTAPYPMHVRFFTAGSPINTLLAVYEGSSVNSLVEIAAADDVSGEDLSSLVEFDLEEGAQVSIAVDSVPPDQGAFTLSWDSSPSNDRFDEFQTLSGFLGNVSRGTIGAGVELDEMVPIAADVGATVWFAWAPSIGGQTMFETTGSSFDTVIAVYTGNELGNLTEVVSNDDSSEQEPTSRVTWISEAGSRYRIVVGGRAGASGMLSLRWNQALPPPANDAFVEAQQLTGIAGEIPGTSGGASAESGEPGHAGTPAETSVWFRWVAPRAGPVRFNPDRSLFPTRLSGYLGESLDTLQEVGSSPPAVPGAPLIFHALAGTEYRLALDGVDGLSGEYMLDWSFDDLKTPANNFENARRIVGVSGSSIAENRHADKEDGEPVHAGDPGGKSVWFRWTAPASYQVAWDTGGSNFDTLLAVYSGDSLAGPLELVDANNDTENSRTSALAFAAEAGVTCQIAVDASSGDGLRTPAIGTLVLKWVPVDADFLGMSPSRGLIGSRIRLGARNLREVASVTFNGVEAEFRLESEPEVITVLVPSGATSGPVTVTRWNGPPLTTPGDFTVIAGSPPPISTRRLNPDSIRLAWSSQYPDFRLEWTSDLLTESDWSPCDPPEQIGGEFVTEARITVQWPIRFFRLALP